MMEGFVAVMRAGVPLGHVLFSRIAKDHIQFAVGYDKDQNPNPITLC